ncbi:PadR family transcriptional regulator [Pseudooceanicola marinus]|uniref:PadR family transcriptional regulator n=1 Tax=Pseudooceanicola marinus TaxID=396013 RepID=UPI000A267C4D|nr:PadR family transcriptional regulator [Pseudooceanicola marinus]
MSLRKISGRGYDVLTFLSHRPDKEFSGYEICGAISIASGTLYPLLIKLHQSGLLQQRWEDVDPKEVGRPRRRYYRISGDGIRALQERERVLKPTLKPSPDVAQSFGGNS